MPANSNLGALPRAELGLLILEGEGAIQGLIGEQILGPLPISFRNAHLVKATLAGSIGLRHIGGNKYIRAMGTSYERLSATFGDATLTVTPRGVEISVPREMVLDYKTKLDVLAFFTGRFGTEIGGLTREYLIAQTVFSPTAYVLGSATNSSVAYTVANRDLQVGGMNPIQDIIASARRVKANGERPDICAMSGPVWERVRTCQNTLQFIRGIFGPISEVSQDLFTRALAEFGIKKLLIGDNYYNSAADSVTPPVLTQIWSNGYILLCKAGMTSANSTEGASVPSLTGIGANVFWEGFDEGGNPTLEKKLDFGGAGGYYVETYPDLPTKSEIIRIEMSHNPTITNNRGGDIIATQYA